MPKFLIFLILSLNYITISLLENVINYVNLCTRHIYIYFSSFLLQPSKRPETDFTLDESRAAQLRVKMKQEKRFRSRCKIVLSFLSLIFFLITVMAVSLILTRGKRMFGSMR